LGSLLGPDSSITHSDWNPDVFNGFAGTFTDKDLDTLRTSKDVEYISPDAIVTTAAVVPQYNAPWGLSRISSRGRLLPGNNPQATTYSYFYDDSAGRGVDAYIIDSGILISHPEFGGRARVGATFGYDNDNDENGHGTHVAGTVGSRSFGVAKQVNLIAVKVLGPNGSGPTSNAISGVNWVATQSSKTGNPSVVNMSFSSPANQAIDEVVAALIRIGVHCVVAAGNSNVDASTRSPARVPSAITVGATDITDARATFSNYGAVLDIFAPGVSILSTTNVGATGFMSGTSMATPHVTGLIAYFMSKSGYKPPPVMSDYIKRVANGFAVTNNPDSTTTRALAYNGLDSF